MKARSVLLAVGQLEARPLGVRVDGGRQRTEVERAARRRRGRRTRTATTSRRPPRAGRSRRGRSRRRPPCRGYAPASRRAGSSTRGTGSPARGRPAPVGHRRATVPAGVEEGLELALGGSGDRHGHAAGDGGHPAGVPRRRSRPRKTSRRGTPRRARRWCSASAYHAAGRVVAWRQPGDSGRPAGEACRPAGSQSLTHRVSLS